MKNKNIYFLIFYIAALLCLASCATRKKCLQKFPPSITTNTEFIVKDSIIFRDTTITLPGDSVTITDTIPCPGVTYEKEKTSADGRSKISVKIKDGVLHADCKTDSLQKIIRGLEYRLRTTSSTTKIIEVPAPVQKKSRAWIPWTILIGIAVFKILKWVRKFTNPF